MRKILLYILLLSFGNSMFSQQIALYSQYFQNNYIINPAVAGSIYDYTPFRLAVRKQWIGISESPSSQVVSLHHQLDKRTMGIGGMLFHDTFGPIRTIGIQTTYAYHLQVKKDLRVSLGFSPVFMQYIINLNQEDFYSYEPILTSDKASVTLPDANVGIYTYSSNYWLGISVAHILQSKINIMGTWIDDTNRMVRHYFVMGGYRVGFPGSHIEIEPSSLIKFTDITPIQVDINFKLYWHQQTWLGISVRADDSFVVMFGFTFDDYFFGFSHDVTFSDLTNHTTGSQELIFGWNFGIERKYGKGFY